MSQRFHISPKIGPSKCSAKSPETCDFKGAPHFDTLEEAYAEQERVAREEATKKNTPSVREVAPVRLDKKTVKGMNQKGLPRVEEAMVVNGDCVIPVTAPKIQTTFYVGESGYDLREAVDHLDRLTNNERAFKAYNLNMCDAGRMLSEIEEHEKDVDGLSVFRPYFVRRGVHSSVGGTQMEEGAFRFISYPEKERLERGGVKLREPTSQELQEFKGMLQDTLKNFDKRLNTYLKRYGTSKLRGETYWRDR